MQLLHIFHKGKNPRPMLLLLLAKDDDNIIGLDCQSVTDADRKAMLSSSTISIDWIRQNCPTSYRAAFRRLHTRNCNILETHEVGENG